MREMRVVLEPQQMTAHNWSPWLMVAGSNVKWRRCTECGLEEQELVFGPGGEGLGDVVLNVTKPKYDA